MRENVPRPLSLSFYAVMVPYLLLALVPILGTIEGVDTSVPGPAFSDILIKCDPTNVLEGPKRGYIGIVVNEVYPDPSLDLNGDGLVDQMDEFIELFNPTVIPVTLDCWVLRDNTDSFFLDGLCLGPRTCMALFRNATGLRLGTDDLVSLVGPDNNISDELRIDGISKGWALQRSPDGSERTRTTRDPTPGENNPAPPTILINEVMMDPVGTNARRQWLELKDIGQPECLVDYTITNHEGVSILLPFVEIGTDERLLVCIGDASSLPEHPSNVTVLEGDEDSTFYLNGDSLELLDREGYCVDFVAWGSSSHVSPPKGKGGASAWDGKTFDALNGTMSSAGFECPSIGAGRSLERSADGLDRDSVADWCIDGSGLGHSAGWNNTLDPWIGLSFHNKRTETSVSSLTSMDIALNNYGNMSGPVVLKVTCSSPEWSLEEGTPRTLTLERGAVTNIIIHLLSPDRIDGCHDTTLSFDVSWVEMQFLHFHAETYVLIPSPDVYLTGTRALFETGPATIVPKGALIDLETTVCGGGELPCGNVTLRMTALNSTAGEGTSPLLFEKRTFTKFSTTSRRLSEFVLDTLSLSGGIDILILADPDHQITECNESNNIWTGHIEVIERPPLHGLSALVISEVLWNTSDARRFVRIENPLEDGLDIGGLRISTGEKVRWFPEDAYIGPEEDIWIAWSEDALDRIPEGQTCYTLDMSGPRPYWMEGDGPAPDPASTGTIELSSKYREPLDTLCLKRTVASVQAFTWIEGACAETTWDTVQYRVRSTDGKPLDSNSSLDWSVGGGDAMISGLLIDPAIGGSGEMVCLRSTGRTGDLSGFMLLCDDKVAVMPNGTFSATDKDLVLSRDPLGFLECQGSIPDLSADGEVYLLGHSIKSTKTPLFPALNLPNTAGKLLLMDRGNREVDSVAWGGCSPQDISTPSRDTFILSSSREGQAGERWRAIGLGTERIPAIRPQDRFEADILHFSNMTDLVGWSAGTGELQFFGPPIEDILLAGSLARTSLSGAVVKAFFSFPPWDDSETDPGLSSRSAPRTAVAQALKDSGVDIWFNEVPDWTIRSPSLLIGGRRLGILPDLTLATERTERSLPFIGLEVEEGEIGKMLSGRELWQDDGWIDAGAFLDALGPSDLKLDTSPVAQAHGPAMTLAYDADVEIEGHLDRSRMDRPEGRTMIVHQHGPLDLVALLERASEGECIGLLLDPYGIHPCPGGEGSPFSDCASRCSKGVHRLDIGSLEGDIFLEASSVMVLAKERGVDLEIRLMPPSEAQTSAVNMMVMGDSIAIELGWPIGTSTGTDVVITMNVPSCINGPFSALWSDSLPLPVHMVGAEARTGNEGEVLDEGAVPLRIEEVYYDTYLDYDPDEYVALLNYGTSAIDASGFTVSDDEGLDHASDGTVMLPEGTLIPPRGLFFIAREGPAFQGQNGFAADLSWSNRTSIEGAMLTDGDLRLSNGNDTVCLRDEDGKVLDVVLYGKALWNESSWAHHDTGDWSGDAVPDVGWGHILFREREYGTWPPPDNDGQIDWISARPRHPGQSRLLDLPAETVKGATVGVCPDSGSKVLREAIGLAREQVLVNVYELGSDWIASCLIGARERGIEVKVLLEGNPVGGISIAEEGCISRLLSAGIETSLMWTSPSTDLRDRYRYDHAKYLVVDSERLIVTSENLNDNSFPPEGSIVLEGTRGWIAHLISPEIAREAVELFDADSQGPDIVPAQDLIDEDPGNLSMTLRTVEHHAPEAGGFDVLRCDEELTAQVLVSPDHLSLSCNPLLEAISGAKEEVFVELLQSDLDLLLQSLSEGFKTALSTSKDAHFGGIDNPYLRELFKAAERGVEVRLLLDGSDFDGDGLSDNFELADQLSLLASDRGLASFSAKVHPSGGQVTGTSIGMVHNKGAVIDGEKVWISSFNWNPTSALENREIGVLIGSPEIGRYFREAFMCDWGSTLLNDIDMFNIVPTGRFCSGSLMTVNIRADVVWSGSGQLEIGLLTVGNDVGGSERSEIVSVISVPEGFVGQVHLSGGRSNGTLLHPQFVLRGSSEDRECDIHTFLLEPPEDTGGDDLGNWFVSGPILPFVSVFGGAVLFSLARSLNLKKYMMRGLHRMKGAEE